MKDKNSLLVDREMVNQSRGILQQAFSEEPLYYRFREGNSAETKEVVEGAIFVDYDNSGQLLGIELISKRPEHFATFMELVDMQIVAKGITK